MCLVFLGGCGAAMSPPAPTSGNEMGGQAAPALPHATGRDAGADATQSARCYDTPDPASVFPSTFTIRADHRVCDLKDRIILVDTKWVTVITRPLLQRTQAPIDRKDNLGNRCGGADESHAGCSITFDRFWSAALGASFLEFGTNEGNVLHDAQSPNKDQDCRESSGHAVIATCSTAKRFVMVRYLEPAVGEPLCWHLRGTVWEGPGDQSVDLEGDVDRVKSVGDSWAFHFFANSATDAAVTLTFDLRAHSATLDTAGEREACIAFRLSQ